MKFNFLKPQVPPSSNVNLIGEFSCTSTTRYFELAKLSAQLVCHKHNISDIIPNKINSNHKSLCQGKHQITRLKETTSLIATRNKYLTRPLSIDS